MTAPATLADQIAEQIRLAILQTLEVSPDYTLHEYLLLERVRALGLGTTRDALRAELAWLRDAGLVRIAGMDGADIPRLTDRGSDAAEGYAQVPGVARPRPRG